MHILLENNIYMYMHYNKLIRTYPFGYFNYKSKKREKVWLCGAIRNVTTSFL
jgi:phosphoribosyl-AMP cyclohydrolase